MEQIHPLAVYFYSTLNRLKSPHMGEWNLYMLIQNLISSRNTLIDTPRNYIWSEHPVTWPSWYINHMSGRSVDYITIPFKFWEPTTLFSDDRCAVLSLLKRYISFLYFHIHTNLLSSFLDNSHSSENEAVVTVIAILILLWMDFFLCFLEFC